MTDLDRLSFSDVEKAMSSAPELPDSVLVGGQALNYWAGALEISGPDTPADSAYGPALSKDIDFLGSAQSATALARVGGGKVQVATVDDANSPNTAVVTLPIRGSDHLVDFLGSLKGFSATRLQEVRTWAVPVGLSGGKSRLLVMHPIHCLESQLENVYGTALDRRSEPGGERHAKRVRLAIEACRRVSLRYLGEKKTRTALKLAGRAHELALLPAASRAKVEDGIQVADAIPVDALPSDFKLKRWPQLTREREVAESKYSRVLERRKALAAKRSKH